MSLTKNNFIHQAQGDDRRFYAKLQRGLNRLDDAGQDSSRLGAALLALHGAIEDYFAIRLLQHGVLLPPPSERPWQRPTWHHLLDLALRWTGLETKDAETIRQANRQRQLFAHGDALKWEQVEVGRYARFVQEFSL